MADSSKSYKNQTDGNEKTCSLPIVPPRQLEANIDPNREFLIRNNEKKWVNHTILHYHFMENNPEWRGENNQKQAVRDAFAKWKDLNIGLVFHEVDSPDEAEIRIGFDRNDGSWSYLGRDAVDFISDPTKRTMNFGWDLTTPYGRDTALHEIGHAMGFPHEHQNPNAGIVWDEEAVYDYFGGPPNFWSREITFHNIIRKLSPASVEGSNWDKDSIMHYHFRRGLILHPAVYQANPLIPALDLSEVDIQEVRKFYPPTDDTEVPELTPFESELIRLQPSEQLDFIIKPPRTKVYKIQTFGEMDTVIALFEEINGTPQFLDADDDSGYNFNSKLELRLFKEKTYHLRLRLYTSIDSGNGAIMMW